ncbi:MAG: M28 family peptidase [Thermoguttaceae bacterium]|jgi:hypothetical protein|nr:M28 family peptidase [Thermoguttaceae bacterium]
MLRITHIRKFRFLLHATLAVYLVSAAPGVAAERSAELRGALESIQANALQSHVDFLADDKLEGRLPGTEGSRMAGEYLSERLATLKLAPAGADGSYFQPFPPTYRNVLALLEGSDAEWKQEYVVIGAHYDHVGFGCRRTSRGEIGKIHNGADDNASGCSAILEMAAAFKLLPKPPRRSILFAFWDAEELGFYGSRHWREHPTVPIDDVVAVVTLDMVGRLRDDELIIFGTRTSPGFRRFLAEQNGEMGLRLRFPWDLKLNSDHYIFFERDIPILLLHTGIHDDYHTPRDIASSINSEGMQLAARYAFRMIYELAERAERPSFRAESRRESEYIRSRRLSRSTEIPDRLGAGWEKQPVAEGGVRLNRIVFDGPAHQAGLRAGDRVLQFAGRAIQSADDLTGAVITAESPGEVVVARRGVDEPVRLDVTLSGQPWRLGVTWQRDDAEPGTIVLTYVAPGTPAAGAGLKAGDRIYRAAGNEPADDDDFVEMVREAGESLVLLIERDGRIEEVTVPMRPQEIRRAA